MTDPTSQADFLATYGSILGDLVRLALYRIGQSVTSLAPVCLLFLPVHFYLTAPWHFWVGATIGSLAGLFFVWQNVRSSKNSQ